MRTLSRNASQLSISSPKKYHLNLDSSSLLRNHQQHLLISQRPILGDDEELDDAKRVAIVQEQRLQ